MTGCRWMTYHLRVHTIIMHICESERAIERVTDKQTDRQTDGELEPENLTRTEVSVRSNLFNK